MIKNILLGDVVSDTDSIHELVENNSPATVIIIGVVVAVIVAAAIFVIVKIAKKHKK